jgi:hypothetical protein
LVGNQLGEFLQHIYQNGLMPFFLQEKTGFIGEFFCILAQGFNFLSDFSNRLEILLQLIKKLVIHEDG